MNTANWKTFREWNAKGSLIKKGEKGRRIDGEVKFHISQTKMKSKLDRHSSWDNADDLNTCGGPMYGIYGNCD